MNQSYQDLVYLIRAAIHDFPPEQVSDMKLQEIVKLAGKNSVTTLLATALSYCEECIPKQLYQQVQEEAQQLILKQLGMNAELEEILAFLESHGIWYMPLKGAVLRHLYPTPELREMCDCDILYDVSSQSDVVAYMLSRGYLVKNLNEQNAECFLKPPIYNFELHRILVDEPFDSRWRKYYENVKGMLVKDDDHDFGYHFTDEDFYVFLMLHVYKHHLNHGTGLRSVLDCYIYQQQKGEELDWNYIEKQEEILGSLAFEKQMRSLSWKIFEKDADHSALSAGEKEILETCMRAGTYGSYEKTVENRIDRDPSRIHFLFRRLVPDQKWYQNNAPFVYRYRGLIPFYLMFRFF